ncbi:MAG: hypothetical protein K6G65_05405 [Lachnospiraceae bacterium]|nr:hypothetical protein [Lachnospiraceae bacterium]
MKYLNSLLYGSTTTKSYLWTIVILFFLAIMFLVFGVVFSLGFLFPAVISMLICVGIFRSLDWEDVVKEGEIGQIEHRIEKGEKKHKADKNAASEDGEDSPKEAFARLENYGKKDIKRLFHKYKVKRDHKAIIIDSSRKYKIRQCPAYAWKDRTKLHFLLLDDGARKISVPLDEIEHIAYVPRISANPMLDYEELRDSSFVAHIFSPYLPNYFQGVVQGRGVTCKNLYNVAEDIMVTNTSARNMFDLLGLDFYIDDRLLGAKERNEFFKLGYKANVLWRDTVINSVEYKNKIKGILTNMAQSEISDYAFEQVLQMFIEHRLVTMEYAEFFREMRW